jgi:hypothetical protein
MADQEVTLVEAAKLMEPSRKAGVIQTYAEAYHPMQVAPVINTGGKDAYAWTVEDDLAASTVSRNVGSDFDATQGNVKPYESNVKIYGGKIKVDEFIVDHSPASIAFQEQSQIRSMARGFTVDLIEGTGGTSLRGVKDWLDNDGAFSNQTVNAGATAGGDLLTLNMMDELVENISKNNPHLYMREVFMRRLKAMARGLETTAGYSQRLNYTPDQFGTWSWSYSGIPVHVLQDGKGTDLLSITEIDGAASQSNTGSIYAIDWGMEAAALFASGAGGEIGANGVPLPKLEMHGDGTNYKYERLTWYVGFVPHTIRCIARIRYLENAVA